jgi:hypothetical protein
MRSECPRLSFVPRMGPKMVSHFRVGSAANVNNKSWCLNLAWNYKKEEKKKVKNQNALKNESHAGPSPSCKVPRQRETQSPGPSAWNRMGGVRLASSASHVRFIITLSIYCGSRTVDSVFHTLFGHPPCSASSFLPKLQPIYYLNTLTTITSISTRSIV